MAHLLLARGATGAEVQVREYGYQLNYRRQLARPWLFLEVGGGVVWRRELQIEPRRAVGVAQLLFEVQFGEERR